MAVFSLSDAAIFTDKHDFSCDTNQVDFALSVEEMDATTFCTGSWNARVGGSKSLAMTLSGFWQAGTNTVDSEVFANIGTNKTAMTVAGASAAGSVAYVFRPTELEYQMFGAVGAITPFSLTTANHDGVGAARGKLLAAKQNISATGALTGFQVGAVSATQKLYVATHVFTAGTSVTLTIQSDDNGAFSSPTTRATIGSLTTAGGTWTEITGPVTDDYWRVNVTAASGTTNLAVAVGIA